MQPQDLSLLAFQAVIRTLESLRAALEPGPYIDANNQSHWGVDLECVGLACREFLAATRQELRGS